MDGIDGFIEVLSEHRRLRVRWSMEAVEDLRAVHNIDAERELTAILAREMAMEIDREIIRDLNIQQTARNLPEINIEIMPWFNPVPWPRCSDYRPKVNWLKEGF